MWSETSFHWPDERMARPESSAGVSESLQDRPNLEVKFSGERGQRPGGRGDRANVPCGL